MTEWREARLGDLIELKRGYDLPSRERSPGAYPIVSSSGITGTHRESRVPGPGVVTGRYGTLGQVYFVAHDFWPLNTTLYVKDFRGNDPRFVSYFLQTLDWSQFTDKAAVPGVNRNHVHELKVHFPCSSEQRAIARVLGALDDKIELSSRVSQKMDQLWQLHLESTVGSWDLNGDSLPAGWYTTPLSSLARFVNGRNFTKDATGTGRMVVRIAELNSGPGGSTIYNDIDVPDEHVVRPGDLLFAWSGSLGVQRWFRPEAIVNQHIFKVVPAPGFAIWFVQGHLLRLLPWYRQVAADKATTMGHIQRYHLDEPVVVPDEQTLTRLDAVCQQLWERALASERESLVLAQLRDALLPKLLSGELRVGDAEKLASAS